MTRSKMTIFIQICLKISYPKANLRLIFRSSIMRFIILLRWSEV